MKRRRPPKNPAKIARIRADIADAQTEILAWEGAVMVEQLPVEAQTHVHVMANSAGLPVGSFFAAFKVFRLVILRMKVDLLSAKLPHAIN